MGKGDIKTRRGKIAKGSFGVTRPRPKSKVSESGTENSKPKPEKKNSAKKRTASKK